MEEGPSLVLKVSSDEESCEEESSEDESPEDKEAVEDGKEVEAVSGGDVLMEETETEVLGEEEDVSEGASSEMDVPESEVVESGSLVDWDFSLVVSAAVVASPEVADSETCSVVEMVSSLVEVGAS